MTESSESAAGRGGAPGGGTSGAGRAGQGLRPHEALAERGGERYELHTAHLNHQLPRMLRTIGFDKVYERAEGAYFWDAEGNDYLDMLAGFGVMGPAGTTLSYARPSMTSSTPRSPISPASTASRCPACSPRSCSRTARIWTASSSATAVPKPSRPR